MGRSSCGDLADFGAATTAKNARVAASLLAFCNMDCDGPLQVVNPFCKLIVKTCYQKVCYKLFQQVVTSLEMTRLQDFDKLVAT